MKMKRTYKGHQQKPAKRYDGVILNVRKTNATQRVITAFTLQQGWLRMFLRKGQKGMSQGTGGLFAFSEVTFDAWEGNGVLTLGEYETMVNKLAPSLTLEAFAYTQILVEMVLNLIPEHEADERVYRLLCCYSRLIGEKDGRILTIIAGWQLIALAGFCPDVEKVLVYGNGRAESGRSLYVLSEEWQQGLPLIEVPKEYRGLWKVILTYDWTGQETIQVNKQGIYLLEDLMYSYVQQCTDYSLRSTALLDDISAIK